MDTYLLQAIRLGNVDILERLLASNTCSPDCRAIDYLSTPALVLCINGVRTSPNCSHGDNDALRRSLAQILLRHGAHLEATDKDSMTAALYAAELGFPECLRVLADAGADLRRSGREGKSAIVLAAMKGHDECLRYLMDRVPRTCLNHQTKDGYTAVMWTVKHGEIRCLRLLLAAGADVNIRDKLGYTALMYALYCRKDTILLTLLLEHGAHYNIVAQDGNTPLTIAFSFSYNENYSSVIKLLNHGADLTISRQDQDFLHEMIVRDQKTVVRMMVMNGCAPIERKCKEYVFPFSLPLKSLSPLAVALLAKRLDIARYFLANSFLTRYDIVQLCWDPDIRRSLNQTDDPSVSGSANEEEETLRVEAVGILNHLAMRPRSLFTLTLVRLSAVLHEASFGPPPKRGGIHPRSLGALFSRLTPGRSSGRSAASNNARQNTRPPPAQPPRLTRRARIERLPVPASLKRALLFQSQSSAAALLGQ